MIDPLVLEDVTRMYGAGPTAVHALRGVSLRVRAGEMVAVMGPSGSGKSTLLTIAGGLESVSSGKVLIDDIDVSGLSRTKAAALRRERIGYVFQQFNLLPALTATENVMLPLELDGVRRREASKRAVSQLEEMGLADRLGHYPDDLSGGEQQRVAIARALVGGGRLILADEPTGALDSLNGESMMRTLRRACDGGASAVIVTHGAQLVAWTDRVVFLRDGQMIDETSSSVGVSSLLETGAKE